MRQLFTRFVERGRIALINYGPQAGKLCVIVDVVDQNRVLIDGPKTITGIPRQQYNLKRLDLTKLKIRIPKGARLRTVERAFKTQRVLKRFSDSSWGRKLAARRNRLHLSDFGRFKAMVASKKLRKHLHRSLRDIAAEKREKRSKILAKNKQRKEKREAAGKPPTKRKTKEEKQKITQERIIKFRAARKEWELKKKTNKKKPKKPRKESETKSQLPSKRKLPLGTKLARLQRKKLSDHHRKLFEQDKVRKDEFKKKRLASKEQGKTASTAGPSVKKAKKEKAPTSEQPKTTDKPKESSKKPQKKKVRITESPKS